MNRHQYLSKPPGFLLDAQATITHRLRYDLTN
jgi:hypothetical protein